MIICPKCKTEVSDTTNICPNCKNIIAEKKNDVQVNQQGANVSELSDTIKEQTEKKIIEKSAKNGRKKNKIRYIIPTIICSSIIVILFIIFLIIPITNYYKANKAFENKEYITAHNLYKKASFYKDAKKKAELSLLANYYIQAQEAYEKGNYIQANELYLKAEYYTDAKEMAEKSILADYYTQAKNAFNKEDYKTANELFVKAGDYEDASVQATLSLQIFNYKEGEKAYKENDYNTAAKYFKNAGDYEDSTYQYSMSFLMLGDYETAYNSIDKDYKNSILIENLYAYLCSLSADSLKDPDSFVLRDIWYEKETKYIILQISGSNSYGAIVSGYWFYYYDTDKDSLEFLGSVSDLEQEEIYSWDEKVDILEKTLNNEIRKIIIRIISNENNTIDDIIIEHINSLHKIGNLKKVKLMEKAKKQIANKKI